MKDGKNFLFIFFIFLGLQYAFTTYLRFVYFFVNKGEEYNIESDKIIRYKNGKKEVFNTTDIYKIEICKSVSKEGFDKSISANCLHEKLQTQQMRLNHNPFV